VVNNRIQHPHQKNLHPLLQSNLASSAKKSKICNQCNKASTHHNHDMTISQENYDWKFETITNLHEHYVKGIQISVRRSGTDRIPYGQWIMLEIKKKIYVCHHILNQPYLCAQMREYRWDCLSSFPISGHECNPKLWMICQKPKNLIKMNKNLLTELQWVDNLSTIHGKWQCKKIRI